MENWVLSEHGVTPPQATSKEREKYLRAKHQGKTDSFVELGKIIFLE
jgi:hypothetical protein